MKRCFACGKWFLGEVRYCPKCRADQWYEKASRKRDNYRDLLDYAGKLLSQQREEKAGVMASAAMEEILTQKDEIAVHELRSAVRMLVRLYTGESQTITDELISDALDYLEERIEGYEDERYHEELLRFRNIISGWIPEAAAMTQEAVALPYQQSFWTLPSAGSVIHNEDGFSADLTRTKGLSLTEICFLFYGCFRQALGVLAGMDLELREGSQEETAVEEDEDMTAEEEEKKDPYEKSFLEVLFAQTLLGYESAGPAAKVFYELMKEMSSEGRKALYALYSSKLDLQAVQVLHQAADEAAERAGLYPGVMLFNGLLTPLLCGREGEMQAVYDLMEPGMREMLRMIETSHKRLSDELEESERLYQMQLIQTLCTEYSNVFAVCEYQRAQEFRVKPQIYRHLLESAAGNGLSRACAEAARCWFFGERGFDVHMEYAKYYTVILKLRALAYPIVDVVDQVERLEVRIPGLED